MPHTPSPLLLALRAGTQACHQRLEARLPFFRDDFDLPAYRRLMQAYYGFHAPLQALLADHQGSERAKTAVLEQDLQALGLSPAEVAALPRCRALPATDNEARALGVMYVIEGSTLGGQVLKRAMAERLGIDGDHGARFLDVYGPLTGAHWRSFLQRLGQPAASHSQTVTAATATFECFEQWLQDCGVLA